MLTFKHFQDRPTWAAAAGYEFNFIDCLSVAADRFPGLYKNIWQSVRDIPDEEIRELPAIILASPVVILLAAFYPFFFWVKGVVIYAKCRKSKAEYAGGLTGTPAVNVARWLKECDRKFKREESNAKSA